VAKLVWWVLCLNLYAFAMLGPMFFLLGLFSLASGMDIGLAIAGQPVETDAQKRAFLACGLAFGALGVGFVWLHRTGRVRFVEESAEPPAGDNRGGEVETPSPP